jgi:riboflavin kinase/FMN adenylyltransferase
VLVIGFFDGVHLGHQYIIKNCIKRAKELNGISIALTFDRPPVNVLARKIHKQLIIPYLEKIRLLDLVGLDYIITAHIDENFLKLSPARFCREVLEEILDIKELYIGKGFRFGYNAAGDVKFLNDFFKNTEVKINQLSLLKKDDTVISSTIIRDRYAVGDIEKISDMLGREPYITGTVVKGAGRGRELGFPTANIDIDGNFIVPGDGVYLGSVSFDDGIKKMAAIVNIGCNPTFNEKKRWVESHIINFKGEIYEKRITVYFYKRIRDEVKFKSSEDLKRQMEKDLAEAGRYFEISDINK